jgi:glycerol kinase
MQQYILALDQGTTSSRAIIFDHQGNIIMVSQQEFTQLFPQPGWVEHDATEIWQTQLQVAKNVLEKAGIAPAQIAAIGITNQRETTVVWEKQSGKPIHHAIVWQDRRTAGFCDELRQKGLAPLLQQKTGLVLDAYFSATKIRWILNNVAGARDRAEKGELCCGTIDAWLLWNLTSGAVHATDVSNASRTLLMNIHTGQWDDELLKIFDVPLALLPKICSSSEIYGHTRLFGDTAIAVAGMAGDQQSALFGQMCTHPGMVKNTYGTGCFMLMNTGEQAITSKNNLLTTIAWKIGNTTEYALEGSVFIAGAVVQWLRDGLGLIPKAADIEALAATAENNGGVYIVPAFAGLGAPYWNQHARGTITGLTRGTGAAHIARAALESIAYQTADVLKAMESDSGIQIKELRVDGGATANNLLMQFQSDILDTVVARPEITETTASGAAYLAGLAVQFWPDKETIMQQWRVAQKFTPAMDRVKRNELMKEWKRAVRTALAWTDEVVE